MQDYKIIAENTESTVVGEYTSQYKKEKLLINLKQS